MCVSLSSCLHCVSAGGKTWQREWTWLFHNTTAGWLLLPYHVCMCAFVVLCVYVCAYTCVQLSRQVQQMSKTHTHAHIHTNSNTVNIYTAENSSSSPAGWVSVTKGPLPVWPCQVTMAMIKCWVVHVSRCQQFPTTPRTHSGNAPYLADTHTQLGEEGRSMAGSRGFMSFCMTSLLLQP